MTNTWQTKETLHAVYVELERGTVVDVAEVAALRADDEGLGTWLYLSCGHTILVKTDVDEIMDRMKRAASQVYGGAQ